jgi:hypothetical protein
MECVGRKGLAVVPGKHEAYHTRKNTRKGISRTLRYARVCTQAFYCLYETLQSNQNWPNRYEENWYVGIGTAEGRTVIFLKVRPNAF